ncbi:spore cortex biosynthesis protein YabQ [Clostridium kluyveri]|uniref:Spore cortex biosynthesis protein YabQ n=1 Tax=Clostridium kluyveri TaxID=1534 RepID=A0A1L5F3C1_CLOKL|nr:spore cortex biosynthesis protein YabQ [Clostridium kluyveri]APM37511.1 spore cortex biosynthesis protein YabQ [Clostridium kluyveri]UZQ52529.1 spore cortex biosynthesis protein YabQ [Clostridium kluyveri]
MIISIGEQIRLIIFSIMAGIITGILFDFYRLIRGYSNLSKIIMFIEDTLFWIFTAIIVFVFLLYTNYAYMGMYAYVLLAVGIYIYMKFFSNIFVKFHKSLFKVWGRIFRIIINILCYPFQYLIYNIARKNKKNYKN